jgi:primosomal protein N' (replication factor Y)
LRLVERTLERGRRALVLVPEIGLTPQLVSRFAGRFAGVPLALLHSGLTDVQRLAAWRRVLSGEARLVLGTRSAVFAPVPELGLIVIDEEHDASFKQQEGGFRYSARDLAIVRAQALDIPVMLGSATPALESLHNVAAGRFRKLSLPRRAAHALPPTLRLIDLRQESVRAGLSTTASTSIERHLAADGQVLVYINRRGYAPTLACKACGWVAPCADCDARMTVHLAAQRLRCHHCGADRPLPRQCTVCGYELRTVGQGTERVEETLAQMFPQAPIARLDRDVVRHAHELEAVVGRVASGEARILVGTQMVTKGHDFPNVTLVVVLNADQGLFSTDFRAAERLAQTIVQVAGRAGRGDRPGEEQAFDFLVAHADRLGLVAPLSLRIRPHAGDAPERWRAWIDQHRGTHDVALDRSPGLAEAMDSVAWVGGLESTALVLAHAAGRRAVCLQPPSAPRSRLPQRGLIHLRDLLDRSPAG